MSAFDPLATIAHHAEALFRAAEGHLDAPVWTWAAQQDVGFIRRHQVQEAAVHHWDVAHAVGAHWSMDPAAAADAVEEFLTFSVPSVGSLGGSLTLQAADVGTCWTVADGLVAGTVRWSREQGLPALVATAPELLLWLYRRIELDSPGLPAEVVARFRALGETD